MAVLLEFFAPGFDFFFALTALVDVVHHEIVLGNLIFDFGIEANIKDGLFERVGFELFKEVLHIYNVLFVTFDGGVAKEFVDNGVVYQLYMLGVCISAVAHVHSAMYFERADNVGAICEMMVDILRFTRG